jgi:hypothetical protein
MVGMGNVGRVLRVDSLTNNGCIFGSMAGLAPTVGLNPNLLNVYRKDTNYCQWKCLPTGCKDGFAYMKKHGLIFSNKATGGIGRSQWSPGINILKGGGKQTSI